MKGIRVGADYPAQVTFKMGRSFRGIAVGDLIQNLLGYNLGSIKLQAVLEREAGADIELLPFRLLDHKRRKAGDGGVIVNVIGALDCADMARSDGQPSLSEPGTFLSLDRLWLDDAKIDPAAKLFRVQQYPQLLVVRDDLRAVLEAERITGAEYLPMGAEI
jgi:hypothetical protein